MLSNDNDSNQSEPDCMSLEKCPHCDKTFEDQHIWNKYNRAKHMSSHTRTSNKKSAKRQLSTQDSPKITTMLVCK
jgi:uncharacterized C2H2 Zn-finger protein